MRIIGLDVGEKRIGVAKADSKTRIAVPVGTIEVDGTEWQEITKVASLLNTTLFVVGLPRNNAGVETKQSLYARDFANKLADTVPGAKVRLQDETLTSVVAESRLKKRGKPYEKGDIDAEAASIILQDFLESLGAQNLGPEEEENETEVKEEEKTEDMAKKKHKKRRKWLIGLFILAILAGGAAIAAKVIKDKIDADRAAYFAELEAQMEKEVFIFEIKPGETIYDIKANLSAIGYSSEEIDEAFNANYDYDFLKNRPEGATLEGFLYGNSYEFYEGTSVKDILNEFLKEMGQVIAENNLEAAYAEQGLTLFEGVTLASVVQREAYADDQPTVAQVFLSRLEYGMLLGSDVTVSYALDTEDPNRTIYGDNTDALTIDSCYNTRLYQGLPCGPISNPGLTALLAVAHPSDSSYLYFLTGDDGLMYYSYTEDEHIQNIYDHCQELCNIGL